MISAALDKSAKNRFFVFVGSVCFVLLFFLFEGYEFGTGNHTVFLPVIESIFKSPHLQQDFGVLSHQYYHPFFNFAMAWLGQWISPPVLFFAGQILLLLMLYGVLRQLGNLLLLPNDVFWFGILMMFAWGQQSPDGNVLWANRLEAQYLAWPWIIFSFLFVLQGRMGLSGLMAGITALFHFQMGLITGFVLTLTCLFRDTPSRLKRLAALILGSLVFGLPVLVFFWKSIFAQKALIGAEFIQYAVVRAAHHLAWDGRLYFLFVFFTALPALYGKIPPREEENKISGNALPLKRLFRLQIVLLVLGLIHYADYHLKIGFVARFQFLRLYPFIYITGVFFMASHLMGFLRGEKLFQRALACLILFLIGPRLVAYESLRNFVFAAAALAAILFLSFKPLRKSSLACLGLIAVLSWGVRHIEWGPSGAPVFQPPHFHWNAAQDHHNPWIDICRQVQTLTPETTLVLSPPYLSGFTFYAKRKTLVEFKSGANHRETFKQWLRRLELAMGDETLACSGWSCLELLKKSYDQLEEDDMTRIQKEYGVNYFITESSRAYNYSLIYQNDKFKLYALPAI